MPDRTLKKLFKKFGWDISNMICMKNKTYIKNLKTAK